MKIETCEPEIVSQQNYQPTSIRNIFINKETRKVCILEGGKAHLISVTKNALNLFSKWTQKES